ncbi:iron-containing alcohol dehydrogenase family protein [Streptococcus cameli]
MTSQFFTNYSVGTDCFRELPSVLKTYGFDSVALIGGQKALAAVEEELRTILTEAGVGVTASFVYGTAATQSNINALVRQPAVQDAAVLIGIGGGQALDTVKKVARALKKELFSVPTICSTCAAATGIAVIYKEDHSFDYYESGKPPLHTFINTRVIAEAPKEYFWAGIGDGISKGPEVTRAVKEAVQRGFVPPHPVVLGQAIAQSSVQSLYDYAQEALQDVANHRPSLAVQEIALAIIVSTAYASNLVVQPPAFDLTTCHAHAFYNGSTVVSASRKHLHGAVVAFGVMVLHAYFEEETELETVALFNDSLGLPVTLADIGLTEEDIPAIVAYATTTAEFRNTPFTAEAFSQAIHRADQFGQTIKDRK